MFLARATTRSTLRPSAYPPADLTIERIGDLVKYELPAFLGRDKGSRTQ